ncbi:Holliday junction branch migration protein RuvA [Ruminococcaceae bacterium AM07-15]|nr:Holliday junction branch migration protein RuvA [Ruminococcaceae bacterium AM07-15]
MFHHIKGTVFHVDPSRVVLDNGGVGYSINTSFFSASAVKKGEEALFYTYLHVREDAMELYGFATEEELSCYKMLTSISGVGPKAALAILSVVTPEKLALCVISEDEKALTKAPGVGKKLAQRIILELKDKLAKSQLSVSGSAGVELPVPEVNMGSAGEALAALTVLGYGRAEAAEALKGLDESLPVEELVRQCLKKLMR